MDNNAQPNENLFYSDLKTRLQRDRREERLYIRLTKNEKEHLRQFAGFGLRVTRIIKNLHSIVEKRVNGRTARSRIGRHKQIPTEKARKMVKSSSLRCPMAKTLMPLKGHRVENQ